MDEQRPRQRVKRGANEYGEGNYVASREYQEATKRFVESGKVEEAARAAEPQSDADALALAAAEAEGKRRAKEEDPALRRKSSPKRHEAPRGDESSSPSGVKPAEAPETPRPGGPEDE